MSALNLQNVNKIIAVYGGIGSGKSVVCRILRILGFPVYDCDAEARMIMDADAEIKCAIKDTICAEAVAADGTINRKKLSETVFGNAEALERLNRLVHGKVVNDILLKSAQHPVLFVETALLYQSGINKICHSVWEIVAPQEIRIERVMRRNNMAYDDVMARIVAQDSFVPEKLHSNCRMILNDGCESVLAQLINNESEIIGIHPRSEL